MYCKISTDKTAIRTGNVFRGLCVEDEFKLINEFMKEKYILVNCTEGQKTGYIIFHIEDGDFVFDLYNFTMMKTRTMTEDTIRKIVKPFCVEMGLARIVAYVERAGMARKLCKMGFKRNFDNRYIGEVAYVF